MSKVQVKKKDVTESFRHLALPCPFCGGDDLRWMKGCQCLSGVMHAAKQQDPKKIALWIECAKCEAHGPATRPMFTKEICDGDECPTNVSWALHTGPAWEAWNIRHPAPTKPTGSDSRFGVGCPFCGSGKDLWQAGVVGCSSCSGHGPDPDPHCEDETTVEQKGLKLWQKRAAIPSILNPGWPGLPIVE